MSISVGIKGVTIGIMGLETPKSGGFFLLSTSAGDTYLTIRQKGDDTDWSQQVGVPMRMWGCDRRRQTRHKDKCEKHGSHMRACTRQEWVAHRLGDSAPGAANLPQSDIELS